MFSSEIDGREFVSSDTANAGRASIAIEVPAAGQYVLWALADARGSVDTNSFYVVVDSRYQVVGLEEGDSLNVRSTAGVDSEIVGTLGSDEKSVFFTGHVEDVGAARWLEVLTPEGARGWVSSGFVNGDVWDAFEDRPAGPPSGFAWDLVSTRCGSGDHATHGCDPLVLQLSEGAHRITLQVREPGIRLAHLVLTHAGPHALPGCPAASWDRFFGPAKNVGLDKPGDIDVRVVGVKEDSCELELQVQWSNGLRGAANASGRILPDGSGRLFGEYAGASGEQDMVMTIYPAANQSLVGNYTLYRDAAPPKIFEVPVGVFTASRR